MSALSIAGDLALYSGKKPQDRLIQALTKGPYSHIAVLAAPEQIIEATGRGLVVSPLGQPSAFITTGRQLSPLGNQEAIGLLRRLVTQHSPYSYWDILADLWTIVMPATVVHTPMLVAKSQFDCSALATLFLIRAGFSNLPDTFYLDPHHVSPNDLARTLQRLLVMA